MSDEPKVTGVPPGWYVVWCGGKPRLSSRPLSGQEKEDFCKSITTFSLPTPKSHMFFEEHEDGSFSVVPTAIVDH